ncbi:unnamed protein product [Cochlearia groenlandica]
MPATDFQGSTFRRSLLTLRRDQIAGNSRHVESNMEIELDSFQRQVAERFADLNISGGGDDETELLSLKWISNLLDSFLCCKEEFRAIVFNNRSQIAKSPATTATEDRLISDYFERSIKALDVCNAIRDGIEQIRRWQKLADIEISALENNRRDRKIGEGNLRRAKKALVDLAVSIVV